ncbi:hypothetical protein TNCV_2859901 [Trichonephila clavipes]|nr:hypothetical protein TNCV_2859901 [Trichonephila clavipes]
MDDGYNKQCSRTEKETKVRQPIFLHRVQKNGGKKELRVQNQKKKVPLLKREDKEKKSLGRWRMCQVGDFRKRNFSVPCHPSRWLSMAEKCSLQRKKFNLWTEETQKKLALGSSIFWARGTKCDSLKFCSNSSRGVDDGSSKFVN